MTTSEELYVCIYLPGHASPVVAGRLQIEETPAGPVGTFVYGRSYLVRKNAVAIAVMMINFIDPAHPSHYARVADES